MRRKTAVIVMENNTEDGVRCGWRESKQISKISAHEGALSKRLSREAGWA
jgi:hypothetical protein